MKPDVPPKHLVSYFALVDERRGKLLLVDHKLAGLWLPSGGHVEPGRRSARDRGQRAGGGAEPRGGFHPAESVVHHGDADIGDMASIPTSRSGICFAATARARLNSIAASFMACDGLDSTRYRSSDPIRTCAASSRSVARSVLHDRSLPKIGAFAKRGAALFPSRVGRAIEGEGPYTASDFFRSRFKILVRPTCYVEPACPANDLHCLRCFRSRSGILNRARRIAR